MYKRLSLMSSCTAALMSAKNDYTTLKDKDVMSPNSENQFS